MFESCIGSINWVEEGEQVHSAEDAGERTVEECAQIIDIAACQAVHVCDQLYLVFHGYSFVSITLRKIGDTAGCDESCVPALYLHAKFFSSSGSPEPL
jgi:hypothetical protein